MDIYIVVSLDTLYGTPSDILLHGAYTSLEAAERRATKVRFERGGMVRVLTIKVAKNRVKGLLPEEQEGPVDEGLMDLAPSPSHQHRAESGESE